MTDANLLVGADSFDDAGVYLLADSLAIVQSVDFFAPVVDDAFVYGQIAAANALSDIYAMGAEPRTALNLVSYPDDQLDAEGLHQILLGGAERIKAAGATIIGGHSVRSDEIKYGLSVTGVVDPSKMLTNSGAQAGDALVLTKALGTGFVTTALKSGRCPAEALEAACRSMAQLNKEAAASALATNAHAVTDITGYGLAGHALEMAQASGVTIEISVDRLPILTGALSLATRENFTRANADNREHVEPSLRVESDVDAVRCEFLFDPQTSGGLLIAAPAARADELVKRCGDNGVEAVQIGVCAEKSDARLRVLK